MKHKHKWEDWGTSIIKGFEGKQTFVCDCGAMMFEDVLEGLGLSPSYKHTKEYKPTLKERLLMIK